MSHTTPRSFSVVRYIGMNRAKVGFLQLERQAKRPLRCRMIPCGGSLLRIADDPRNLVKLRQHALLVHDGVTTETDQAGPAVI